MAQAGQQQMLLQAGFAQQLQQASKVEILIGFIFIQKISNMRIIIVLIDTSEQYFSGSFNTNIRFATNSTTITTTTAKLAKHSASTIFTTGTDGTNSY
jgi:hypothetical protein